ncbi:hypothetical protein [Streptomyces sp. I8-5]|uniref:hypothetical protein n=1 Tax=Streptomyces sp. I8-5 TaxID=3104277 RepID=UPI003867D134
MHVVEGHAKPVVVDAGALDDRESEVELLGEVALVPLGRACSVLSAVNASALVAAPVAGRDRVSSAQIVGKLRRNVVLARPSRVARAGTLGTLPVSAVGASMAALTSARLGSGRR